MIQTVDTIDGMAAFINSDGFLELYGSRYNEKTKVHSQGKRLATRFRTVGEYNQALAESKRRKQADSVRAKELKLKAEAAQLSIE